MNHILFTSVKTRKYGASRMTWHYASALLQAGYRVSLAYELDAEAGPDSDESIIPEMREIGVECVRVPRLRITV